MTKPSSHYAELELQRASKSLQAAECLLAQGLTEDCVSRSYYAVLHAAKAALAIKGIAAASHMAVRKLFGLHLIKSGIMEKEWAEILTAQQEDRELGDYGIGTEIDPARASARVQDAARFVAHIHQWIQQTNPDSFSQNT